MPYRWRSRGRMSHLRNLRYDRYQHRTLTFAEQALGVRHSFDYWNPRTLQLEVNRDIGYRDGVPMRERHAAAAMIQARFRAYNMGPSSARAAALARRFEMRNQYPMGRVYRNEFYSY